MSEVFITCVFITCLIVGLFACFVGLYRCFNHGRLPRISISEIDNRKVYPIISDMSSPIVDVIIEPTVIMNCHTFAHECHGDCDCDFD